ncbi:hypothetical protein [Halorientalis salina]|uniref:hypothetical protein n=1 Tax=Halorientalis salina TaxID=2932266 RepID=UPI00145F4E7C|nr:hypothetical protein [Halorientalis salina]
MRLPLPTNRLVALTLLGALATAVVASAIVVPGVIDSTGDTAGQSPTVTPSGDAPQPNEDFTPAVSGGEEHEDEEYEDDKDEDEEDEHEDEEDEEDEEDDDDEGGFWGFDDEDHEDGDD